MSIAVDRTETRPYDGAEPTYRSNNFRKVKTIGLGGGTGIKWSGDVNSISRILILAICASTLTVQPVAALTKDKITDATKLTARLANIADDSKNLHEKPVADAVRQLEASDYKIHLGKKSWRTQITPACANASEETRSGPSPNDLVFFINNPVTLYGLASIPVNLNGPRNPKTGIYPFQGDDVLIIYGYTPPPITYFSFTMNQKRLFDEEAGAYADTNSSIGLSVNQDNIKTLNGAPFDDFFALIVTANFAAADVATQFLNGLGVPTSAINYIHIPKRFTDRNPEFPDDLEILSRLTFRTDAEATTVCDFARRSPPAMGVFFLEGPGGNGDVEDSDLIKWEATIRVDTSERDAGVDIELEELAAKVQEHYEALGYVLQNTGREKLKHIDPDIQCRLPKLTCNFDAPDAVYGKFVCDDGENPPKFCIDPLPNFKTLAVIVGVNHNRFGLGKLAAYYSYSVTRAADLQGIVTILDIETLGSADEFVADTSLDPENFFVIQASRDCTGKQWCMEVPWSEIGPRDPIVFTTRSYLDRETASGPNPDNFVPAKLLRFTLP